MSHFAARWLKPDHWWLFSCCNFVCCWKTQTGFTFCSVTSSEMKSSRVSPDHCGDDRHGGRPCVRPAALIVKLLRNSGRSSGETTSDCFHLVPGTSVWRRFMCRRSWAVWFPGGHSDSLLPPQGNTEHHKRRCWRLVVSMLTSMASLSQWFQICFINLQKNLNCFRKQAKGLRVTWPQSTR